MPAMNYSKMPLYNQVFVVTGVLSTILSCGLGLGYLSIFLEQHERTDDHPNFDPQTRKHIDTAGEIAFLPSIVIIPFIMQKKGRRIASFCTALPILLSWIINFEANNSSILIITNILHKISLGGAVAISSVIISEFCDPKYRAAFLMSETATMSLGVLLSHIFGLTSNWELISAMGILTTVIGLIVTYFSPESPYWLISQGHIIKGTECFYWLRGAHEDALKELDILLITQKNKLQLKALRPIRKLDLRETISEYLKSLMNADFLKPMTIMILLFSFVGFGGENIVSNYSLRSIFNLTNGKYIGTIILDVLTLICSLTACVLLQLVKRKTLFLFTGSISILFLGLSCVLLLLQSLEIFSKDYLWIVLSLVTGFVMFMSLGTTALPFSLLGEIFPLAYKGVGSSLTCAYLWGFGNSMLRSVPLLTNCIGLHGMLLITLFAMIVILVIVNKVVPETHAKNLLEIEQLLKLTKDGDLLISSNEHEIEENFDRLKLFIEV